jgi:hypothetical protein
LSFLSALIFLSLPAGNLDILPSYITETIRQSVNAVNEFLAYFQD